MSTYINTILTVSIVGGIINSVAPIKSGIKKYINYIVSLISILCLISPLVSVLLNINSIKDNIQDFTSNILIKEEIEISNSLIVNTSTEHICNGIKQVVIDKYGFEENEVYVELALNKENIESLKIECVNVILSGKASWSDAKQIENYLKNLIGTEIEVKRK